MPALNSKLIAFVAGGAIALLAVLVVDPLLDSDPRPPVPSIDVGREGPPPNKQAANRRDKKRPRAEARTTLGGQEDVPSPATHAPTFTPAPPPSPKPEAAPKPPAAAPLPPTDDDDDLDDDDSDDGEGNGDTDD